jgi:hypothetical protein
VKLAYLDLDAPGGGPAVVLHREADTTTEPTVAALRSAGVAGRVVVPFGDYAYYPSGMEVGGVCWYRVLPGFSGTDPISLTTAVVQVCDLLDDLALDDPLVVGTGQGAVVALGAGLVRPDRVGSVVAVDPWPVHVSQLPSAPHEGRPTPPVLLASVASGDVVRGEVGRVLADRGIEPARWSWSADDGEVAEALAGAVARWRGRSGSE